jgi:hypothetical protein
MRGLLFVVLTWSAGGAEIRGTVRDAVTGELLSRVSVQIGDPVRRALTGKAGEFAFAGLPAGDYRIKAMTVGFHLVEKQVSAEAAEVKVLEILLTADALRRREAVEVRADGYLAAETGSPGEFTIEGNEVKNLASVLADDPLRSVHSMPGVSSNDDFESRFSIHGAPYERVGLYLDGVLLHQPFHTVQGEGPSGSMAAFNGDMVESMTLASEGYSPRYGDRTAGVLDVRTRDGDQERVDVAASAGVAGAGLRAEGPFGGDRKGSWLIGMRKSYLQYLLQRSSDQPTMAFGFLDSQEEASYNLSRNHKVKLEVMDGTSAYDRSHWASQLGLNTAMLASYRITLANLGWQYSPGPRLLVESHAAYMRERYDDENRSGQTLGEGTYGEWTATTGATWIWAKGATFEAGGAVRRIRGEGFADYYATAAARERTDEHRGTDVLAGAYAQQRWSIGRGRLEFSAGARWDRQRVGRATATAPQAAMALTPWRSARIALSWGQYTQFGEVESLFASYGSPRLRPARATHYLASWEQRFGGMTRLRVTAYRREDRDLLFRPMQEARMSGRTIMADNWAAPIENSLRGRAEGVEVFLQRRTANRLTGWVSYSLGYTRMYDRTARIAFPADEDQRHTANVYLGYRARPSVNLSMKWSYGSGFPVPGFFRREGSTYYLAEVRNGARLGAWERLDFRINKSHAFRRWKATVYGEVVNVLNRANYRFDSYNGFDGRTGQANLSFLNLFPVLPAAGVVAEF